MNPVQYIILDHTLSMPTGKAAAQAAHASLEGFRLTTDPAIPENRPWDVPIVKEWYKGGHYTKIVLQAENLPLVERYLNDRGIPTALIIDEGRTVFDGKLTPTAIGCPVLDKDDFHVVNTFSAFELFTSNPSVVVLEGSTKIDSATYIAVKELIARGDLEGAQKRLALNDKPKRRWFRKGTF